METDEMAPRPQQQGGSGGFITNSQTVLSLVLTALFIWVGYTTYNNSIILNRMEAVIERSERENMHRIMDVSKDCDRLERWVESMNRRVTRVEREAGLETPFEAIPPKK